MYLTKTQNFINKKMNMAIKKVYAIFIVGLLITPTLLIFFTESIKFLQISDDSLLTLKSINIYISSFTFLTFFIIWSTALIIEGILKYKIHEIAGLIGIGLALLCLAGIPFHPIFVYTFIVSGFLCLYSSFVQIMDSILPKFNNREWEPTLLFGAIFSIVLYFTNAFGSILLNEIFSIDASYFPKTIIFAMLLVGSLFSLVATYIYIIYFSLSLIKKASNSNPGVTFFQLTQFITAITLLIFSFSIVSSPSAFLERVATSFDFNSHYFCNFDKPVDGVITLDPAHTTVLTYRKKDEKKYNIERCILGEDTDNKEMATNNLEQSHPDAQSSSSTDS